MAWRMITFSCFFFHAEDGIRDLTVTGVQTCALPISRHTIRLIRFACTCTLGEGVTTTNAAIPPCLSRSEEHTSELQSQSNLVCRLLLEKKKREDEGTRTSAIVFVA